MNLMDFRQPGWFAEFSEFAGIACLLLAVLLALAFIYAYSTSWRIPHEKRVTQRSDERRFRTGPRVR